MIPQYLDHIRYCQVCCRLFNPRIKNRLDFQFKITAISLKPNRIHDKTKLILYPPKYKLHNPPDPKHTYIRIYTSRHIIYYAMHWKVSATKEVNRALEAFTVQGCWSRKRGGGINISSVVEFQGWWVLKGKIFGQESTYSKEKNMKNLSMNYGSSKSAKIVLSKLIFYVNWIS